MADFMNEDKPRRPGEVVIEDLRHRRDVDEGLEPETDGGAAEAQPEPEPEAEPAAAAEPAAEVPAEPAAPPQQRDADLADPTAPGSVAEAASGAEGATIPLYEAGERIDAAADAGLGPGGDSAGADLPPGVTEEDIRAAEREQLRQLLGLGIVNYLRYQLSMIYNFAVINLGGVADPSSGLVAKDLGQAKVAIDVFEFIVSRIEPSMQAEERAEMRQLIQQIKYAFMQAAAEELPPTGPAEA